MILGLYGPFYNISNKKFLKMSLSVERGETQIDQENEKENLCHAAKAKACQNGLH